METLHNCAICMPDKSNVHCCECIEREQTEIVKGWLDKAVKQGEEPDVWEKARMDD